MDDLVFLAMLAEEYGHTDTRQGQINRVARHLARHGSDEIDNAEFLIACRSCGVDPYALAAEDLQQIQDKLNRLT